MAGEKNTSKQWPPHKWEWAFFNDEIKEHPKYYSHFGNLSESEARRIWALIEEKLFPAYKRFVRVWPDWSSSSMWSAPFPGAHYTGPEIRPNSLGLSAELQEQFKRWQLVYEHYSPWNGGELDWEPFNEEKQRLTRALKREVGESVYVECDGLQEVLMDGTTRNWRLILGLPEAPPGIARELDK